MCFDQIEIMRGEAFTYGFRITTGDSSDQTIVTDEDVDDVEISFGSTAKTYTAGQITYEGEGVWGYPISQEESFDFPPKIRVQIRVKFKSEVNEVVLGKKVCEIPVVASDSRTVL